MSKQEKLISELNALEKEFEERLLPLLRKAVTGHNDLVFLISRYQLASYPLGLKFDPAEDLLNLGDKILRLREKLEKPLEDSLAYRYEEYCRQFCDLSKEHVKAQHLAIQFLTELGRYHVF